jgi:hypothetical protein
MMNERDDAPGPLREEKEGQTADPGTPQPEAAEVESARLLAADSRDQLRAEGFSEDRIRELADQYIAEDRGTGTSEFVDWARRQGPR